MGEANSTMSAKCCGCCALALMAIASVLACIALSTDFWYTGIYKVTPYAGGDKFYAAATMGLEKACFYPKTVTADTKEPDGSTILGTKDWNCGKWKDTKLGGDTEDCKKAVDASLGFGILGVIGTAPFAAICLLFYCCPGKNCCASMMHWINIAIGLGVFVCFLISLGVTVGQCDDYAKKDAPYFVTTLIVLSGITPTAASSSDTYVSWSAILMILAMVFSFIAWPVYWRFKCLCDAECAGECENQQPAKNPSGAQA